MKTVLYVEESENALVNALILRQDIQLLLIRFCNSLKFSCQHLQSTMHIPVFILDKKADFEENCTHLATFLREECNGVDIFFNDSEFNQVYIQRIARALHLPGALTDTQSDIVRDKLHMKEFLRSEGIPCSEYAALECLEDAVACGAHWGYPFIIKWRIGVSSIEVYKINSLCQLQALKLEFSQGKYMAEKYQPDKIWCLDAIVSAGSIIQNLYTWLPYTNLDFAQYKTRFCQMAVGFPPQSWKFDTKRLTQRIVSALKLQNGYLHLEAFISSEGIPTICEFAWRTPGDHILQNFTLLYGCSVENLLIDVLLEKSINPLPEIQGCVADIFLPMTEGIIRNISSISSLQTKCQIHAGEIFYHRGDQLVSRRAYTDSTGWVQVIGVDIPDTMKKVEEVYCNFILETEAIS